MAIEVKIPEANIAVAKEHLSDDDLHQTGDIEWTSEDEKRIRQRMDWRIVPTVLALYLMCFIDRSVIYTQWIATWRAATLTLLVGPILGERATLFHYFVFFKTSVGIWAGCYEQG